MSCLPHTMGCHFRNLFQVYKISCLLNHWYLLSLSPALLQFLWGLGNYKAVPWMQPNANFKAPNKSTLFTPSLNIYLYLQDWKKITRYLANLFLGPINQVKKVRKNFFLIKWKKLTLWLTKELVNLIGDPRALLCKMDKTVKIKRMVSGLLVRVKLVDDFNGE